MAEAAAIISGFKWLAPVATELLKKGYSFIGMDVDKKLQDLQNVIIPQIEMVIEAAENSPHKERLRGWLKSLEEAVYEAEDVLDLHDYYLLEQKVKNSAGGIKVRLESLPLIKGLAKTCGVMPQSIKLKKSLMKLEKTAVKVREFQPFLPGGNNNVRGSKTDNESGRMVTTSRFVNRMFGRDKQRDHIIDLLHETTGFKPESSFVKNYSIVAIVGLGGAGKTTLAQHVCDHEREAEAKHFDVIMWVHVSQQMDVEKLTREMVESASGKKCPDLTNLDTLQRELEDSLRSKKFLLVLDEVWGEKEVAEVQWEQLLAPLSVGNRGSKILLTTREQGVAKALHSRNILDLKELEKNDFLSLFKYYAFGDADIDNNKLYEELEEILRQNTPKLHGSPLAARMVGSQLRKKPDVDFWKKILSGDLLTDTRKSLFWSYQNLDTPLQRCFSYCSLFTKGQYIRHDKLICLWIAEGFIKSTDESKRIKDVGREYFDDLLSSSFFQPIEHDGHHYYIMHDLLHDLAEMISKDRCIRVEGNLTNAVPREIRHLSLYIDRLSDLVEKICNFKNLRTLIVYMWTDDDYIDDLLHSIFIKLKKLRVVDLSECRLNKLPESIGNLKHLRYLDLHESSFEILPKSVSTLYHLDFLHMSTCRLVAKRLANWINLQHLYFFRMILNVAGIGSLKQLENLRKFQGSSIHINSLENVKEKGEAPVDIKGIAELCLEWSTTDNINRSSDMDVLVLEGLRPPSHLQYLKIVGYQGCLLPSWKVGNQYLLHNLISLELIQCRRIKLLPILSPTLTKLVLSACSSLPIVSKEDLAIIRSTQDVRISQVVTFMEGLVSTYGSRIVLKIEWDLRRGYDSQKLRNLLEKTMDIVYQTPQEEEVQLVLPPSLESLDISSCPLTNSTLREGLRGLTSLESLNIFNIVSLTSLPSADVLGCLTMLGELYIKQCWFLTSLGGLHALGSLCTLFISFCPSLSTEGGNTSILPSSLQWLEIEACHWKRLDDSQPDLTSSIDLESSKIPFAATLQLGHLKSLTKLSITNCPNIGSLLGLQELNNLEDLTLMKCPKLTYAETKLGSHIEIFSTDAPSLLYMLLAEEALASLRRLRIEKFKKKSFSLEEEQVFQHLTSLTYLDFESCSIKSLPNNLGSLSSLEELFIIGCPNIMSLSDLPTSLLWLDLTSCNPVLKRRCQKPHSQDWRKIAHIPTRRFSPPRRRREGRQAESERRRRAARGRTRRAWMTSARWATGRPPTWRHWRPRRRTSRGSNLTAGRCSWCPPGAGSPGPSTSPAATSPFSSTATPSY